MSSQFVMEVIKWGKLRKHSTIYHVEFVSLSISKGYIVNDQSITNARVSSIQLTTNQTVVLFIIKIKECIYTHTFLRILNYILTHFNVNKSFDDFLL